VLWGDGDSIGFILYWVGSSWVTRRWGVRTGWGAEQSLPGVDGAFEGPSLLVRSGGEIEVIWLRRESGTTPFVRRSVWVSGYAPGSGWRPAAALDARGRLSCSSSLSPDGPGALAVWSCQVAEGDGSRATWSSRVSATGAVDAPRALTALPADVSLVRTVGNGDFTLGLWSSTQPGRLWGARILRGRDWEQPQLIAESSGLLDAADLLLNASGEGLAVWRERQGFDSPAHYSSAQFVDGRWLPAFDVTPGAGEAGAFQVLVVPSGDAVAVWSGRSSAGQGKVSVWWSRWVR
jgi:hypothetical protein